jgi:UDP-N-acetylmuramyl tripeptide synthase
MMKLLAIYAGKITYVLLRMIGRMAGTLPGLIAEKIDPNILSDSLSKLPKGVVVVTGTNGKTTTTKILTEMLSRKYRVLTNPTGSNFTRGIAAAVVSKSTLAGRLNYDIAVIELDEAYAVKFVEKIQPDYSIILNVTRDQMDRFGEIDHTAKLLETVVKKTKKAVVLNADDNRVRPMKLVAPGKVYYFGVSNTLSHIFVNDENLHTAEKQSRQQTVDAELISLKNELTTFSIGNDTLSVKLNFFGLYNSQNAVAASLMANKLGIDNKQISDALSTTSPAFGRGEIFDLGSNKIIVQLVKNPAGFRQALIGSLSTDSDITCLVINDNYADGRDVSWLWDVEFSQYIKSPTVITSGHRAYDMSVRLAYDDIMVTETISDLGEFVNYVKNQDNKNIIIFTTYTAMLKLRSMFGKIADLEEL